MRIEETLIDNIIQRVLTAAQPQSIILFGSAATGDMNDHSDIDLLIIESGTHDLREERRRIRQSLRGLAYPFDIIVMERNRFEESKNVIGGIAYPASHYGKVIYAVH